MMDEIEFIERTTGKKLTFAQKAIILQMQSSQMIQPIETKQIEMSADFDDEWTFASPSRPNRQSSFGDIAKRRKGKRK